jgi:zinc and cadmium transporter
MTLHGLMDGVALAAAVKIDAEHGHGNAPLGMLFGIGTFIAVLLHKPFDALTIGTLMAAGGWSINKRHVVNLLYALMTPLGVALFLLGASKFLAVQDEWLGCVLSFAGGAFVCIATSDLLPELQFHSHDRFKLSFSLLLGVALAWGIVFLESAGHANHDHNIPAVTPVD